jgi:hypothetical protein
MSKRKKKKKGVTVTATTDNYKKWFPVHNHGKWVEVGEYKVWLRSSGGTYPSDPHLDVYVDLSGFALHRHIPPELAHLIPSPKPLVVEWEVSDGAIDYRIHNHVVTLLKAGYVVGWGCLGGHGRTGWLAAKVHMMLTGCTGRESVNHIRSTYCHNAIETLVQLRDLGVIAAYPHENTKGGRLLTDEEIDLDEDGEAAYLRCNYGLGLESEAEEGSADNDDAWSSSVFGKKEYTTEEIHENASKDYKKYLKQWDKEYGEENTKNGPAHASSDYVMVRGPGYSVKLLPDKE